MAWAGSLAPDSFINPSLPLYLMLPPLWLQRQAADAGLLSEAAADPLLLGRALSAAAGALAVFALGMVTRRALPRLGVLPPLLLALSPGFVNLCHFATPEAWLFLGSSATLVLALDHVHGRAPAWVLGLALGLTASTKYTGAALLAPALAAVWLRPAPPPTVRQRTLVLVAGLLAVAVGGVLLSSLGIELASRLRLKDARLLQHEHAAAFMRTIALTALGAGAALTAIVLLAKAGSRRALRLARPEVVVVLFTSAAGFFAGTPYALLEPLRFLSDLAFNHQTRAEYKGIVGASTSYLGYLGRLDDALTGPLLGAAAVGALAAIGRGLRGERAPLVILLGALGPYLLVASSGHQAMRFLVPVLPPAAWLASLCLSTLLSPRVARLLTFLVVGRVAIAAFLVLRLFYVDSRILAERWMEAHLPPGEAVDFISNNPGYVPTVPGSHPVRVVPTLSREMAPRERFAEAAAQYADEAAPWLVLTASYYERFLDHAEQFPERAAFFRSLLEGAGGFEVVARFRQERWLRPRAEFLDPEIVILRKRGPEAGR